VTSLVILGASTRAAAMSARRAGWTPWCADLFADADLQNIATVRKIAAADYPDGLLEALQEAPPGPVMYTGALENRPDLIAKIDRPLLGNSAEVLRAVRSPRRWSECLAAHSLPCPKISDVPEASGQWILKPRRSAGGFGIHVYTGQAFNPRTHFLQEHIDGIPASALFIGRERTATLIGVTEQLIGTRWLNASGFHYAGSIGPLNIDPQPWRAIGAALAASFNLVGIFGVDAIVRDGIIWPVEINPRYTASVEIFERSFETALLKDCGGAIPAFAPSAKPQAKWGKAILFARKTFEFPDRGPWTDALKAGVNLDEVAYADIPHAGEITEQGRPVLTVLAPGSSMQECRQALEEKAQALDRRLWG
jgi:predicted ATP-grasp superfamily ATP-dependent carboligase